MSVEDSLQILYPTVISRIPANGVGSTRAIAGDIVDNDATSAPTIDGCIAPHEALQTPEFGGHMGHDASSTRAVLRRAPSGNHLATTPSELAQTFISSYQIRSAQIKPEVLELMANHNSTFIEEEERIMVGRAAETSLIDASMRSVVETSFAAIEPYAAELNHKLAGTDMRIACTPPDFVAEHTGNARSDEERSYYRARISTKTFSIVIRGSSTTVNFYMLPVSLVMALSKSEDHFKPLMSFTATAHGACLDWEVEGKPLTAERQERYCLLLFNYLLEQTREQLMNKAAEVRRA